jgi:hypothetical protein
VVHGSTSPGEARVQRVKLSTAIDAKRTPLIQLMQRTRTSIQI